MIGKIIEYNNQLFLVLMQLGPLLVLQEIVNLPQGTLFQIESNSGVYYIKNNRAFEQISNVKIVDHIEKEIITNLLVTDDVMYTIKNIVEQVIQRPRKNLEKAILESAANYFEWIRKKEEFKQLNEAYN